MLDAVLFDLDGTLTDPAEGITGAFRHAVASVGHPADDDGRPHLDHRPGGARQPRALRPARGAPRPGGDDLPGPHDRGRSVPGGRDRRHRRCPRHAARGRRAARRSPPPSPCTRQRSASITSTCAGTSGRRRQPGRWPVRSKSLIVADALAQLGNPDPSRVAMVGDRHHDIDGAKANACIAVAVDLGLRRARRDGHRRPDHTVDTPPPSGDLLLRLPVGLVPGLDDNKPCVSVV